MAPKPITENTLFYGDNLTILRQYIPDECIDLVYLDPPFNSSRNYNVLFKDEHGIESESQITAFEDTWHWNMETLQTYNEMLTDAPDHVGKMISSLHEFIGENQMMAYLVMMTTRLVELHRILKSTGSLYLHCDPTASHYLKIILDFIFGIENYRGEIVWQRTATHNDAKRWPALSDTIFFYSKKSTFVWNPQYRDQSLEDIEKRYRFVDEQGRRYRLGPIDSPNPRPNLIYEWKGYAPPVKGWRYSKERMAELDAAGEIWYPKDKTKRLAHKLFLDESRGALLGNIWTDISPLQASATERLGYPTQKPLELLERIVRASSNPGDIVLDPFCGCGTAIAASQKLDRKWVGIDITHLSIALMKYRLEAMYPGIKFKVVGEPKDVGAAHQLASEDRYQFQWWALSLVRARPLGGDAGSREGKKGSDKGIDGVMAFIDDQSGKAKRVLVQVKSGHVKSGDIRDLIGTVEGEKAAIGVFITLEEQTEPMKQAALKGGFYHSIGWGQDFPRIQILTIEELLHGKTIKMPPQFGTFKQAQRVQQMSDTIQEELGLG